jgi:Fur family transcriptional regulator, ferric uptake regulator
MDERARREAAELCDSLRAHGLRLTPQRRSIVEAVVAAHGHISAELVFQTVHERFPDTNVSTVYRTLERLQEVGYLTHGHAASGAIRYHLAAEPPHQHLACQSCGAEQVIDVDVLRTVADRLASEYGFAAHLAHFTIVGICSRCQEAGASSEPSVHRHRGVSAEAS